MRPARRAKLFETLDALGLLIRTTLLFRLRGRRAVARATRVAMAVEPASQADLEASRADIWAATRALRRARRAWPVPVRCLQSALVLQELLRRRGAAGRVRIGSRLDDDRLQSHAWVEVGDYVLDPQHVWADFVPLPPAHDDGGRAATPPGRA